MTNGDQAAGRLEETHSSLGSVSLLSAKDITRRTPSGQRLLGPVSLRVYPGDRWVVRGPNGSGKTVLLRTLALLEPPQSGAIRWQEAELAAADIPGYRRQVVYLHQQPVLLPGTIRDNLEMACRYLPQRPNHQHDSSVPAWKTLDDVTPLAKWLSYFEKPLEFLQQPAETVSGGEAQLVALWRALICQPAVLLLDESTAALTAKARYQFEDFVNAWVNDAKTERAAVWVTHDEQQALRVAEKTLTLDHNEN